MDRPLPMRSKWGLPWDVGIRGTTRVQDLVTCLWHKDLAARMGSIVLKSRLPVMEVCGKKFIFSHADAQAPLTPLLCASLPCPGGAWSKYFILLCTHFCAWMEGGVVHLKNDTGWSEVQGLSPGCLRRRSRKIVVEEKWSVSEGQQQLER